MEKSSYCCCCRSLGCFNTGERNFHLSTPHSRPCAQHHISPLLSFPLLLLRSSAPTSSPHSLTHSFLVVVRPGSSSLTQSLWASWDPRDGWYYPDQTSRYSKNFKCLLNYLTQKLQTVTHRSEVGERGDGGVLPVLPDLPGRDSKKEKYRHCTPGCFDLTSIKKQPAGLPPAMKKTIPPQKSSTTEAPGPCD